MSDKISNGSGLEFTGALTIAFIVLKLTNVITWSWWWVLSPIWILLSLAIVLLIIIAIFKINLDE